MSSNDNRLEVLTESEIDELYSIPNFTEELRADYFTVNDLEKDLIPDSISSLKIITGENRFKMSQRHIWIRFGEVDIDITADQFSSTARAVFVEANSNWHKRFTIKNIELPNPGLTQLNEEARSALLHDYKKILFLANTLFTKN